jgi:hypothetical protein
MLESDTENVTRATALQTLALAPLALAGVLAATVEADAVTQGHIPQASVHYQPTPKNGQQCNQCSFFINNKKSKTANGGCTQVAGSISPKGWCAAFSKGDNSKQTM